MRGGGGKMKKRSNLSVMARLIGLVKPLTGYMLLAILMGLCGHICAGLITILGGYAVMKVLGYSLPALPVLFTAAVIAAVLRGLLRYGEQSCNHFIAFKLLALIRDRVFRALRKLAPAKLEGKDKGNLMSVITSDIELLEVFYAHTISPAAIALLFSLLMTVYIGSYHWMLGIWALVSYLMIGVVQPVVVSRLSGKDGMEQRKGAGELSGYLLDSLRGLSETIQYGQCEKRLEGLNTRTDALLKNEEKMKRKAGRNTALGGMAVLLCDLVMLALSAYLMISGRVGFDGVLIPTLALMSSFGPVLALSALGSTLQNTFAAGNRGLDILDETPVIEEVTGQKEISFTGAAAKDVHFSYGAEEILRGVSLCVLKGKIIGLSGKSGSGKSTLLKLFMRFWETDRGTVSVSDVPVNRINTANLRKMESFVTQDTHLFHDSIRKNLLFARPDASEEEMIAAAKKASVHDFIISLPKGYDTPVGELGDTLSGGERQRLGLARAFLHDAPLMLLDEPTSNLDSLNEAVILRALKEEGEERTVLIVSHRASTMKIADTVYSIDSGRMS